MKFFVALALLVAAAVAAPPSINDKETKIVRSELNNIGVEGYSFAAETSDGTRKEESGVLKNVGSENEALEVRGAFAYVAPDGVTYTVTYLANENGFQPQGAHLPVAPVA